MSAPIIQHNSDGSNPGYRHTLLTVPLHIRAWDWVCNLPHRFGRWVDRTNAGRLFCLSVGVVLAGGMAVSFLVGLAK